MSRTTVLQPIRAPQGGMTLVEVAICLGIFSLLAVGFLRVITDSQRVEEATREMELVEDRLFVEVHALRAKTTLDLRRIARSSGVTIPLQSSTTGVTHAPAGASEGPTYGGVELRPVGSEGVVVGRLLLREVASDGETPSNTSGYFKVTATAAWVGVVGEQQVEIVSWVTSHADR